MTPVSFRPLAQDDAALYRDIRLEALRVNPEAFVATPEEEGMNPLGWFADRITGSHIHGAFAGHELIGVAGYFINRPAKHAHKGYVWGVYVKPPQRGRGVARQLMERLLAHAAGRAEILQLTVGSANDAARKLYESLGFVQYGLEKNAMKNDGCFSHEILMARDI